MAASDAILLGHDRQLIYTLSMEAPRVYCTLAGPRPPEDRAAASKDAFKLKSFLPKVLFRDNIGLQVGLEKHQRHLNNEEKRSISYWNHSQKVFRNDQFRKDLARYISLQNRQLAMATHHKQGNRAHHEHYNGTPYGKQKMVPRHRLKLPPLQDPRFLKLETTLVRPSRNS